MAVTPTTLPCPACWRTARARWTSNWETTDVQPITAFAATFAAAMLGADVPFYVNIHTGANPGGEIRGQLVTIATDNGETVNGTSGNDILPGLGGDDAINGGAGNDSLDGGTGADTMTGGSGNDTYFVDNAGDAVIESAGNGTDTVNTMVSYGLTAEVENLVLQGGADLQGYGNTLANMITGNAGGNLLDGGVGADTMTGGAGGDTYFVDDAGDTVVENVGEGSDAVFSTVHYAADGERGDPGAAGQRRSAGLRQQPEQRDLRQRRHQPAQRLRRRRRDVWRRRRRCLFRRRHRRRGDRERQRRQRHGVLDRQLRLAANVENLILLGSADLQGFGNGLGNVIYGNTGNNLLDGGAGVDLMVGGAGDDIYFVDDTSDSAFEVAGQGNDAVFASAHYGLAADVETLVLQGSADLQGYGSNQVNTLYGNIGNNLLNGAAGADTMYGGLGNDTYFVDNAMDAVVENLGEGTDAVFASVNYTLTANVEALVLNGPGNLSGTGNALANSLFGNAGNNALDGGAGVDVLQGNAGNDTFVFNMGQGNGDTVVDFAGNGAAAGDSLQFVGLRRRRDLHQHRRDALAGQLQRRRLARRHHVPERRGDRRDRLRFHVTVRAVWRRLAVAGRRIRSCVATLNGSCDGRAGCARVPVVSGVGMGCYGLGMTFPVESSPNTPPPMPWHSHGSPTAKPSRLMHVCCGVWQ